MPVGASGARLLAAARRGVVGGLLLWRLQEVGRPGRELCGLGAEMNAFGVLRVRWVVADGRLLGCRRGGSPLAGSLLGSAVGALHAGLARGGRIGVPVAQ